MKGAALLWMGTMVALGFVALIYIGFNEAFTNNITDAINTLNFTTNSVVTNVTNLSLVWAAIPIVFVLFALFHLIVRAQKENLREI